MKKILALLLACIMLTAVLTGCGNKRASTETAAQPATAEQTDATASDGATYTLKLAHDANTTSAYQLSALELKRMIEEKSDGRIKVEVYPAQQLGSAQEMIEGMQMGTIEATLLPTAKFGGFDQTMNILDMPFLFPDEDTLYEIMNGELGEQVMAGLPDIGIRGCAFYGNGFKAITNNIHPIESPDDLKGLKIRTMENDLHIAAFNALGAIATPMASGEVFTALQQGTIDAAENAVANLIANRYYEITKNVTMTNHVFGFMGVFMSDKAYNTIPADLMDAFMSGVKAGADRQRQYLVEANDSAREELVKLGVNFYEIPMDELRAVVDPAMEQFSDRIDPDWVAAIEADKAA